MRNKGWHVQVRKVPDFRGLPIWRHMRVRPAGWYYTGGVKTEHAARKLAGDLKKDGQTVRILNPKGEVVK